MTAESPRTWRQIPKSVIALGLVSMFMDMSSELVHSLLPLFLVGTLGASAAMVGFIEGIAEATAAIAKVFSGAISDRIGKRKLLAALGYGLSALTKPLFPVAGSVSLVLTARFIDRVGKGIRGAPRDALVADITPSNIRGAAYGMRQALDTVGAVAGPLLAMALMAIYVDDFRSVFWWAVLPATIAVALMVFGVQEPSLARPSGQKGWPIQRVGLNRMGSDFWWVVIIGVVFTMARFSEAFLLLKGQEAGLPLALVPLVMVLMNLVYAILSTPAGAWSDSIGRRKVLAIGMGVLVIADLSLAFVPGLVGLFLGVALWGAYLGLTQGLLSALVADTTPDDSRGTAFGIFNLVTGFALLAASSIAGFLWQAYGSSATFVVGAIFAGIAALSLTVMGKRKSSREGA
ncbi:MULTISPECIES: MFS transporter [Alphaproteobacteria]|uniref:MFS transporter n=2 Tax=Alphaproteobacteria TaxID=28211 RepID=A0A512HQC4_9HYPH|nr:MULTISPECIES: MFS transporter [Alphaproteobacteria]GEO87629.1 MFS transporter [Ciceribacter naphthalenivorans]GLR23223.1 MFS transporter [Ciceribacter naphthalenivorans]GLT06079.1 MFS transporter [Sphingomonas psychrolutea]